MHQLIDNSFYYHGSIKNLTKFNNPSIRKPFFVCKNIDFCKTCFGDKTIVKIKFDLDKIKVFDFNDMSFLAQLQDVPQFIKDLLCGKISDDFEELFTCVYMFSDCWDYVKYAKNSYDEFRKTKAGRNKNKSVEFFLNNWYLPDINYPIKDSSKKLNVYKIYEIFHWMCSKIKNVDQLCSDNGIIDTKSRKAYSLIAELFLKDIKKSGYNVFANLEIKDNFSEKTFGIIDKNVIARISFL